MKWTPEREREIQRRLERKAIQRERRQAQKRWLASALSGGDGCCEALLLAILIAGALVGAGVWVLTLISRLMG